MLAGFNDLVIEDYDIKTVQGLDRKTQDVTKALMTRQGSNVVYPSYGTPEVVGNRNVDSVNALIRDGIMETMGFLQQIETSTDPNERLSKIVSLTVVQPLNSPEEKQINLVVQVESGLTVRSSFPLNGG